MRIHTVPVEAYRQAGAVTPKKAETESTGSAQLEKKAQPTKIILPGGSQTEAGSIRADRSPSLLADVLSPDEKDLLVKYFARFGDSGATSPVYNSDSRQGKAPLTGLRLDVKA